MFPFLFMNDWLLKIHQTYRKYEVCCWWREKTSRKILMWRGFHFPRKISRIAANAVRLNFSFSLIFKVLLLLIYISLSFSFLLKLSKASHFFSQNSSTCSYSSETQKRWWFQLKDSGSQIHHLPTRLIFSSNSKTFWIDLFECFKKIRPPFLQP